MMQTKAELRALLAAAEAALLEVESRPPGHWREQYEAASAKLAATEEQLEAWKLAKGAANLTRERDAAVVRAERLLKDCQDECLAHARTADKVNAAVARANQLQIEQDVAIARAERAEAELIVHKTNADWRTEEAKKLRLQVKELETFKMGSEWYTNHTCAAVARAERMEELLDQEERDGIAAQAQIAFLRAELNLASQKLKDAKFTVSSERARLAALEEPK